MEQNELYPIFLKVNVLNTLIVGGGNVALEKLEFLLKSSPRAKVVMVAPEYNPKTLEKASEFNVEIVYDYYNPQYLENKHIVIITTDKPEVNIQAYNDCKKAGILVNVADNPPLCDFYMGGIVTKGNVKIAISTNGKSPTTAKRLRQFLEDLIPAEIDDFVNNLRSYRETLKGDFEEKVSEMNRLTKKFLEK